MPKTLPTPAAPAQQVTRGVLAIRPFRKLWNSMLFSSLGDWLGLLATTAMAQQLSGGDYAKANFAIAGVFIARLTTRSFPWPNRRCYRRQIRSPQINGELRHPARSALHLNSNCKQLFLALHRDDLG